MAQLFPPGPLPAGCIDASGNRDICLNVASKDPQGAILIVTNQHGHLLNCNEGTYYTEKTGTKYNIFYANRTGIFKTIRDLFINCATVGGFPGINKTTGDWIGVPPGRAITITAPTLALEIVTLGFTNCPDFLDIYAIPCTIGGVPGSITFRTLITPYLIYGPAHLISTNPLVKNPAGMGGGEGADPFNDKLKF
jgi:hypothetical protein